MTISDQLWFIAHNTDPETGELFDVEVLKSDPRVIHSVMLLSMKLGLKTHKLPSNNYQSGLSERIFDELRNWRLEKSKEIELPAYYVFSDKELVEIASSDIETKEDLMLVKGVGPTKYELYGDEIFSIVSECTNDSSCIPTDNYSIPEKKTSSEYPYNIAKKIIPAVSLPDDISYRMDTVINDKKVISEKYKRDKEILLMYFKENLSYESIGDKYGITRSRVGQIINRGLKKLKRKAVIEYLSGNISQFNPDLFRIEIMPELTASQLSEFKYEDDISISEMARKLTGLKNSSQAGRVNYYDIALWLMLTGDLVEGQGDNTSRTPTEKGIQHGFLMKSRKNSRGVEYTTLVANISAQRYIIEHYREIYEAAKSHSPEQDF